MSDGAIKKISRVIFWRYRRGGWQYDILCFLILLFIFLVPRSVLDGSYFSENGDTSGAAVIEDSQIIEGPAQENPAPEENQNPAEE